MGLNIHVRRSKSPTRHRAYLHPAEASAASPTRLAAAPSLLHPLLPCTLDPAADPIPGHLERFDSQYSSDGEWSFSFSRPLFHGELRLTDVGGAGWEVAYVVVA